MASLRFLFRLTPTTAWTVPSSSKVQRAQISTAMSIWLFPPARSESQKKGPSRVGSMVVCALRIHPEGLNSVVEDDKNGRGNGLAKNLGKPSLRSTNWNSLSLIKACNVNLPNFALMLVKY
ncbi:hypothetical protein COLO4_07210 [Corchorus olitorius]|uniref:Uncharacterized protein n=1 Tax=Corchorus olitorius TaxID=93759 RepID=A0A1R3KKF0_9ROSI|nr:hypothetical protein COLO4_07210 [Corchorus olitorius]